MSGRRRDDGPGFGWFSLVMFIILASIMVGVALIMPLDAPQ